MPQTRSTASSAAPPWNTLSRLASTCSSGSRRSQLHSTTARRVRWRGAAVRLPLDSSPNASSSRAATSATGSERSLAAASSIASGRPSSARHMRTTSPVFSASTANPGRTAAARSANNLTAGASMGGSPARGSASG
ncbi:hypothetical protein [Nonomuraea sp. NPDC049784]|uniref:hypothetical protein n=1 Tax=Nonomuraea sp. NPDC049784 TaxID=3154361 RepID=UPI0033D99124